MDKQTFLRQAAEETASMALTLYSNIPDAKQGLAVTLKKIEADNNADPDFKEFSTLMMNLAIVILDDFIIIG